MKQTIYGIVIGLLVAISIAAIRPSRQQIILTYAMGNGIEKDLQTYFSQGFRVIEISPLGSLSGNSSIIVIMER